MVDDFISGDKIKSDGTYKIYFSLEHQYAENVHGLTVQSSNTGLSYLNRLQNSNNIKTVIIKYNDEFKKLLKKNIKVKK